MTHLCHDKQVKNFFFSQVATIWSANPNRRRIYLYGGFESTKRKAEAAGIALGLRFQAIITPAEPEFHGVGSRLSSAELGSLKTHLTPQAPDLIAALERLYFTDLPRGRLGRAPFRLGGPTLYDGGQDGQWSWIDPVRPWARATLIAFPNRPLGTIDIRLAPGSHDVLLVNHANWSYRLNRPDATYQVDPPQLSFGAGGATLAKAGPLLAARLDDPAIAAATLEGLAELGRPLRQAADSMAGALARMG